MNHRYQRSQAKREAWIRITGLAPSVLGHRRAAQRHAQRKRDAKAGRSKHALRGWAD